MTEQQKAPNLNTYVSIAGFLLTLLIVGGGGLMLVSRIETQVIQQKEIIARLDLQATAREARITAVERVAASAAEMAGQDARRLVDIEARVRAAEQGSARFDERLVSLQADLRRLIAIVERIERNGSYQQP
jgi:hypothetical protein